MSESPALSVHPEVAPTDPHSLPGETKAKPPPPQDQCPLTTNRPEDSERREEGKVERKEERKGDTTRLGEAWRFRREIGDLKGLVEKQKAEISELREAEEILKGRVERGEIAISKLDYNLEKMRNSWQEAEEKLKGKLESREDKISKLDHNLEEMRSSWQEAEHVRARQAQGMQEQLKRIEELLTTKPAELFEERAFLSTADRLSEMEVLSIVRELNENIYQVAACLTEGWMEMESSKPPDKAELDLTSQQRLPTLVQLARNRDLTGLTFLIQLHLCYYATKMTSSWAHDKDFVLIKDIYQRLSASEGQTVSARWRSLTHNYLSAPPLDAKWLAERLAGVLDETGSFQSAEQLTKFIQAAARERIEEMIRTAQRLEAAFMVDVTSCDMSLIFHDAGVLFEDARMTNEFGADSAATPREQEWIAGTTEVGVQKSVCKKSGEPRHVGILLKPKVILEKDVAGDGK